MGAGADAMTAAPGLNMKGGRRPEAKKRAGSIMLATGGGEKLPALGTLLTSDDRLADQVRSGLCTRAATWETAVIGRTLKFGARADWSAVTVIAGERERTRRRFCRRRPDRVSSLLRTTNAALPVRKLIIAQVSAVCASTVKRAAPSLRGRPDERLRLCLRRRRCPVQSVNRWTTADKE